MSRAVPAIVVAGPGTNRDADVSLALTHAGAEPRVVRSHELAAQPEVLDRARLLVVAGGFSHGDALGAGRLLALELTQGALGEALVNFVAAGRPVLGICNGFQVLTSAGLLPGSLGHNASGRFDCRWVTLTAVSQRCVWTRGLTEPIDCPIAHGEGRYVHNDIATLEASDQIALRYSNGCNPNGSDRDVAGVCDPTGVVLGLMPHPENAILTRQVPRGRATSGGALALFTNGVMHAKEL